jgi:hypothetical protein
MLEMGKSMTHEIDIAKLVELKEGTFFACISLARERKKRPTCKKKRERERERERERTEISRRNKWK